ncbi:LysR family transcriptional regulator [Vibrio metschnikovii]
MSVIGTSSFLFMVKPYPIGVNHESTTPLNALRAFEASARLGSFTKAADELNVTQAAVSQQVKILEHHLKATLFTREAKGIRLTDAGQSYQPVLTQVFHSLRIGTEDLFGERGITPYHCVYPIHLLSISLPQDCQIF